MPEQMRLSDLQDFAGFPTILQVLESKEKEVLVLSDDESSQIGDDETEEVYAVRPQQELLSMPTIDVKGAEQYSADAIQNERRSIHKAEQHSKQIQQRLQIDWTLKVLGSYPVCALHDFRLEEQLTYAERLASGNDEAYLPIKREELYAVVARDCYGAWIFFFCRYEKASGLQIVFVSPLLHAFALNILHVDSLQWAGLASPCKAVRYLAFTKGGEKPPGAGDVKIARGQLDSRERAAFLLSIDGFCFCFEATAEFALGLRWALDTAYESAYGGDRTLFQVLMQRAISIRCCEQLLENHCPEKLSSLLDFQKPYSGYKLDLDKMVLSLLQLGKACLIEPALAGFRTVAFRQDGSRNKILQELYSLITQKSTNDQLDAYKKLLMTLYEQVLLFPYESRLPQIYGQIAGQLNVQNNQFLTSVRDHLRVFQLVMEQLLSTPPQPIPFPQEFDDSLQITVDDDAPQLGKINVVLLNYHPETDTVECQKREDLEPEFISPCERLDFSPDVFGRQFETFLAAFPTVHAMGQMATSGSLYQQFLNAVNKLQQQNKAEITYAYPKVFCLNRSQGITRTATIFVFVVAVLPSPADYVKPLELFADRLALFYAGDSLRLRELRRLKLTFTQQSVKRQLSSDAAKLQIYYVVTCFRQDQVLVQQATQNVLVHTSELRDTQAVFKELRQRTLRALDVGLIEGAHVQFGEDQRFVLVHVTFADPTAIEPAGFEFRALEPSIMTFAKRYQPEAAQVYAQLFMQGAISEQDDFGSIEHDEAEADSLRKMINQGPQVLQQWQQEPERLKNNLRLRKAMQQSVLGQFYLFYVYKAHNFDPVSSRVLNPVEEHVKSIQQLAGDGMLELSIQYNDSYQFLINSICADEFDPDICEQLDAVEVKTVPKQLVDLLTRLRPCEAGRIASEQVKNDQFVRDMLDKDRRDFDRQTSEIESHILDLVDQFDPMQDEEGVQDEDGVIEDVQYTRGRLAYLYKLVMYHSFKLDVPKSYRDQKICERVFGEPLSIVTRPRQTQRLVEPHFQEAVGNAALHLGALTSLMRVVESGLAALSEFTGNTWSSLLQPISEMLAQQEAEARPIQTQPVGKLLDAILLECELSNE